jgi:hypothetical protein
MRRHDCNGRDSSVGHRRVRRQVIHRTPLRNYRGGIGPQRRRIGACRRKCSLSLRLEKRQNARDQERRSRSIQGDHHAHPASRRIFGHFTA